MLGSHAAFDRLGLDLDPRQADARKARRRLRLNTVEIPRLRTFGLALLAIGAGLHDRYLLHRFTWENWLWLVALASAYAAFSWVALAWFYARIRVVDLSALFLGADLLVWAAVVYLTGATDSWLFAILLVRPADQIAISFRRALVFAHLAPLAYALVVLWAAIVDGVAVSWEGEVSKILFLYIIGLYMASVARIVDRRQTQRAATVRLARDLVRELRIQSSALSAAKLQAEAALDQQAALSSERAQLHERTRRQQRQLQQIFDSTSDGLVLVGTEGRVESANATAGQLLGFDPAAAAGVLVIDLLGDTLREVGTRQRWRPSLGALLTTPERLRQGDLEHAKTGRILQWASAPARDEFGVTIGLTFTFQDVTRNRDLIRQLGDKSSELEAASRQMAEAHRTKEEFLANVSHEIRTPLSAIVGMSQLAMESATQTERHYYLEKLRTSADVLLGLINDILDFSRIDAGRFSLVPAPFALSAIVESALDTVRLEAEQKGLTLARRVAADVPDGLVGDGVRLRQVLLNLLSNAVKFTERGEVSLRVEAIGRQDDAVRLEFAVTDTGIGIPPEKQQSVFEAFVQADGSTTRRYTGAGLGLSIASQLAELMGGEIGVESEVGRGSTFRFRVQFGLHAAGPAPAPATSTAADAPAPRVPVHVLVADDNAIQRELAAHLLIKRGYRVVAVPSGAAALAEFDHGDFDIVLLDLQMPDMDGFQTAAALRRREAGANRRVPIVAITASAMKSDRDRCLEVGIDDYLSKPVTAEQLIAVVAARTERQPDAATLPWRPADRAAFLSGLGDDLDLARRLVVLFLEQGPALVAEIARALERGDADALHRSPHALKGAMGNFPVIAAQDVVARLELTSLQGNVDAARILFPPLQREMDRLRAALPKLV